MELVWGKFYGLGPVPYLKHVNYTCYILLLVLSFTGPFHRYSTTTAIFETHAAPNESLPLTRAPWLQAFSHAYTQAVIWIMHIIVGDTFLRLKISHLPSSTRFERLFSKYMGQRVPKGWERNIWRILNNGESRKKPTCDGVGPTF